MENVLMNYRAAISITMVLLVSACDKKPPPLTNFELQKASELKTEIDILSKKYKAVDDENKRIKSLESTYFNEGIKLDGFSVINSTAFSDGLPRPCVKGTITNTGTETLKEINSEITIISESDGSELLSWNFSLFSSNYEFIKRLTNSDNPKDKELLSALYTLETKATRPLKPGGKVEISNGHSCNKHVVDGWKSSDVKMKITSIKLQDKGRAYPNSYWKLMSEWIGLRDRAKNNNQIIK